MKNFKLNATILSLAYVADLNGQRDYVLSVKNNAVITKLQTDLAVYKRPESGEGVRFGGVVGDAVHIRMPEFVADKLVRPSGLPAAGFSLLTLKGSIDCVLNITLVEPGDIIDRQIAGTVEKVPAETYSIKVEGESFNVPMIDAAVIAATFSAVRGVVKGNLAGNLAGTGAVAPTTDIVDQNLVDKTIAELQAETKDLSHDLASAKIDAKLASLRASTNAPTMSAIVEALNVHA